MDDNAKLLKVQIINADAMQFQQKNILSDIFAKTCQKYHHAH